MKKHYRHENNCLNCGTTLEGKFCHNCGQENLEIKESFGHMMGHAISDYFHFDHQFLKTLKPLLFKPGHLTTEYMAGRRVQYLHPVKMYIFISVVYFLLLFKSGHEPVNLTSTGGKKTVSAQKIIDSVNKELAKDPNLSAYAKKEIAKKESQFVAATEKKAPGVKKDDDDDDDVKTTGVKKDDDDDDNNVKSAINLYRGKDSTYAQYLQRQNKLPANKKDGLLSQFANKKIFSYKEKYGSRAKEVFMEELKHNLPKMMFILLPLVALILKVTFWKNKKFYVEHLIYTFHLHCFLFLFLAVVMLLQMVLPDSLHINDWLGFASFFYIMWYIYRSLRVMYNRSRFRTVTKIIGMSFTYLLAFSFCVTLIFIITALTAA